jgi:Skp family chaperone for outer membrane proteins
MEKHLNDMINRFGNDTERRNIVIQIFGETIMKIQDPKQRIGAIIYALEGYVFRESDFGDVHDSDITDATYTIMEQAEKKYNTWLKARLVNLEKINADIKKHQQELVKHQQELVKKQQELAKNQQELAKNQQELAKHQQELAKHQQELAKNQQELDKTNQQMIDILNKVSVQDVKTKENIRQMVIEAKILFFKYKTEINPHIDELFTLVP